jgi:hypothetical protein
MGTFRILVFTYPHHNLFAGPIGFKLRWSSMSRETGFSESGNPLPCGPWTAFREDDLSGAIIKKTSRRSFGLSSERRHRLIFQVFIVGSVKVLKALLVPLVRAH